MQKITFFQIRRIFVRWALLGILFLGLFLLGFFLVNLNLHPAPKLVSDSASIQTTNVPEELKKRLGSTDVAMESYGDWTNRTGLAANNGLDADPDNDKLPNYLEYMHGTNPLKADTDGDGFSDSQEIANGFDPDAPGDAKPLVFVHIAKLGVDAPMVWSQSDKENLMLSDLEKGVSHFSKTAAPGQNGNAIVSGHSSNFAWAKGDYNYIFKDLNGLANGDRINIKTIQQNGRIITYTYVVTDKFVTAPDDQKIFANTENPTLTLATCWPIGTNLKRIIVKAQLMQ